MSSKSNASNNFNYHKIIVYGTSIGFPSHYLAAFCLYFIGHWSCTIVNSLSSLRESIHYLLCFTCQLIRFVVGFVCINN